MKLFPMWCAAIRLNWLLFSPHSMALRRSEVVGLKWDAIDFEKKTFTIKHTVYAGHGGRQGSHDPERPNQKTKSSYRTLPLAPAL